MGLDVYVGTFTRYYQRDWLTIVQQAFPGRAQVVRPLDTEAGSEAVDPETVRQIVAEWSRSLARALNLESLGSEDASKPYFTNKPGWDGFGGLLLWAAYYDQSINPRTRREAVTIENWSEDEALIRYRDPRVKTQFPQLLLGEEIWLPNSAAGVFKSVDASGTERMFGNCQKLLDELNLLNDRTWKADAATRSVWLRDACEHGSQLEVAARFGWSVMHQLASKSVEHSLPIILDY
jgi:hypothetical protein